MRKNISKIIGKIVFIIIVIIAVIFACRLVSKKLIHKENNVSYEIIGEKFKKADDLVTYSFEYHGTKNLSETFKILDLDIPFLSNKLFVKYKGIIKVGYKMSDVKYKFKKHLIFADEIVVTIPKAKIVDEYIKDRKVLDESNNIFNKIEPDAIVKGDETIMKQEKQKAIKNGLYEKAEKNFKKIVEGMFKEYDCSISYR